MIRKTLEDFWREAHVKSGYELVYSPHIARLDLWKQSGHLQFYKENMYAPMDIDGMPFELKPMNCPFHIMIYKSHLRSYRDLPFRWAELGTVYRYERSGFCTVFCGCAVLRKMTPISSAVPTKSNRRS